MTEAKKHQYFRVGNASNIAYPKDGLCIFAGDAPVKQGDGERHSLSAPIVYISSIINSREEIAKAICEILNNNADTFFPSAAKALDAPEHNEPERIDG